MREVKALTDYYEKVIYADLISKNIKPDRYGGIRKSVKLHGASGISVRISGYGKTPRECAEKLAFAEIKHNSEAGLPMTILCAKCCIWHRRKLSNDGQ